MEDWVIVVLVILGLKLAYWVPSGYLLRNVPSRFKFSTVSLQLLGSKVIAHRGSKLEGLPENTLTAFKRALDVKADMIELDVWLTKDSKVVVFHDGSLARMCDNEPGHVTTMSYDELPPISSDPPERIPLFSEVLDLIPDNQGLIVEVKQDSDELNNKVYSLLQDHERTRNGSTTWFSLKWKINKKLAAIDPDLPRICSVEEMLLTYVKYYAGILPFQANLGFHIMGLAADEIDAARIKDELKMLPLWLCRFLALFVGGRPSVAFMCPKLIDHIRARGGACFILGVNEDIDIPVISKVHATGALTDKPAWLRGKISISESKNVV